jgi:hypothetical protein
MGKAAVFLKVRHCTFLCPFGDDDFAFPGQCAGVGFFKFEKFNVEE